MSEETPMEVDISPPEEAQTIAVTVETTTTTVTEEATAPVMASNSMDIDVSAPAGPAAATGASQPVASLEARMETVVTPFPHAPASSDVFSADLAVPNPPLPLTNGHDQNLTTTTSSAPLPAENEAGPSRQRPSPSAPSQISAALSNQDTGTFAQPSSPAVMTRTGYIYDPLMLLHCHDGYTPTADSVLDSGAGHPEEPMRIKRIFSRLAEAGLIKRMKRLAFSQVTLEQVLLVHTAEHWEKVQGTEILTDEYIQESKHYYDQLSLYVCRETAHCARLSCGGVVSACKLVCNGEVRNAFAIVRPPGHHAEPDEHMGFCFFNNVAVAAKEVIKLGMAKKVLILDWDVHHGNGTQRAFWNDPNVLYISIHRHDGGRFYPTSDFGALDMVGVGAGEGKTINIPWPTYGFGDGDYIYAFQKIIMPIAYEFAPDLVIISAGFDAAEGDSLGGCKVTPPAYGHMTHMLCALAGGKVVVALEGGYNLEAISLSANAVAEVLLGETPAELSELEASEVGTEVMYEVAKVQSKYWKSINVKACEPPEVIDANGDRVIHSIPDLLKIHRAHHLFSKHGLFQIPLASLELDAAFGGQVICNEGVYEAGEKSVLVVFVHDFGNLRVETDGITTTNVHMTNSYLLDTSDLIVRWVKDSGFNIIDVNILKQLPTDFPRTGPRMISKEGPKLEGLLMRYLWDNYIELSESENVVLIGHGTGCRVIMELINHRDVERKVKAVVQVAGLHSLVRIDPNNESRREWFKRSNRIYVPSVHPVLEDERVKRRLGGQVFTSERARVVDVLNDVLPQIQTFVTSKLGPPIPNGKMTNGNGPSHDHEIDLVAPAIAVL